MHDGMRRSFYDASPPFPTALVGCIKVYLFDTVLLLRAAKRYPVSDSPVQGAEDDDRSGGGPGGGRAFGDEDPLAHITNTARQTEDKSFSEEDRRVNRVK